MADILISKFTTQIPRVGATPATPGFAESEGQDPVAPSGSPLVYTPVTIGSPANGLSINASQVLTIGLASTSATGALSSTDWNTFNNKLNLTSPITGYTVGANTALAATDTILQAFGKVQGQINARISGTIASGQVAFGTGVNTVGGDSGLTWDNTVKKLTIQNYSVTGSGSDAALSITGTWNTTGQPTAISLNVTDTASNSGSILMSLAINGSTLYRFRKDSIFSFGPNLVASIRTTLNGAFDIRSQAGGSNNDFVFQNGLSGSRDYTSGSASVITTNIGYIPTSGTGTFSVFTYTGVINQTGGASGVTRGIYINPTLTSAPNWRSFQWDNNNGWGLYGLGTANNYLAGSLWIGTTSGTNTLDVNGTARIRTISNLGTAATSVLVPSATGVVSLRTLAELSADMSSVLFTAQTLTASQRNQARVNIGSTSATPQVIATAGAINDLSVTSNHLVFTGASVVLSGIVAGLDGEEITILNASGTNLELLSQSALSVAANRFASGVIVPNLSIVRIKYRTTTARWVLENVGINDGRYVRKDVADTKTGNLTLSNGCIINGFLDVNGSASASPGVALNRIRNAVAGSGIFQFFGTNGGSGRQHFAFYGSGDVEYISFGNGWISSGVPTARFVNAVLLQGNASASVRSVNNTFLTRRDELHLNYSQTVATAGTINDLAINADCKLLILTGADDLTGVVAVDNTRLLRIEARGANRIIRHESASSTAANRFSIGADLTINAGEVYQFIYTDSRWRRVL